jgi:hypothetical protein
MPPRVMKRPSIQMATYVTRQPATTTSHIESQGYVAMPFDDEQDLMGKGQRTRCTSTNQIPMQRTDGPQPRTCSQPGS